MNKKTLLIIFCLVCIASLILSGCEEINKAGLAITADYNRIQISKDDIKECCKYINKAGEEKSCVVFKQYSCDYCSSLCNKVG